MPIGFPQPNLRAGSELYKYVLIRRIGHGNFGQVWLAMDRALNHQCAIKILPPGTPIQERLQEGQIGHQLNHRNVVRVHQADVVQESGQRLVVLAMDYIENGSVTNLKNSSGYLDLPDVMRLGRDILKGLEYLHSIYLVHNDVKPENVLIGPQGQGMLTDYGIVGRTTSSGPTPAPAFYKVHAAPEVVEEGLISTLSDVYQVGLTLFRMLVGLDSLRCKFDELGEEVYYRAVTGVGLVTAKDFPAYVPPRLRRVIRRATSVHSDDRYQSAIDMRRELEKLSYPGFWTVSDSGEFLGRDARFEYRVETSGDLRRRFDVAAYRRNASTGRETRVVRYCHRNLTKSQAKRKVDKFVRGVVEGLI